MKTRIRAQPGRAVTATEVGRAAGVSQSAVSRAFTPGASISGVMRERVLRAAQELGYRPNIIARSLMTRRSNIIGIAVAPLENPFYAALIKELAHALRLSGRHLLLFPAASQTNPDPDIDEVLGYQLDALVLASTTLSSALASRCERLSVPVLLVNRVSTIAGVPTITGENVKGGRWIARYLVAGGHKRIALIVGNEQTSTSRDRERGFVAELRRNGRTLFDRQVGNYATVDAESAVRRMLSEGKRPDAIFVANDYMAVSVIKVITREFGLAVPDDISIVGFDGLTDPAYAGYALTTYSQPVAGFVRALLRTIDELVSEPGAPKRQLTVPGELIVGGTTRRPAVGIAERNGRATWRPPRTLKTASRVS